MAENGDRRRLAIDSTMLGLAVVSLGLVFYELTADLTPETTIILDAVDLGIVLIFLTEFIYSARTSGDAWQYTRKNWYDLPSMIWLPTNLLEGFAGLRLLRFVRLIRVLRTVSRLRRVSQYVPATILRERVVYIGTAAIATIVFGGMSFFVLEVDVNPAVDSLDDGIWWAIVTTATVGYGDIVPFTGPGRIVGVILMVVGIGIIGTLAGSLADALLQRRRGKQRRRRIYSKWRPASED